MASESTKRTRAANFTNREIDVLVDGVVANRTLVFSKHNDAATNDHKKRAWQRISSAVNAVSVAGERSIDDLRLKWRKLHSDVKQKAAKIDQDSRRTGGGPAPRQLTEIETKILGCIPEELVKGIPGSIDSSENYPPPLITSVASSLSPCFDPDASTCSENTASCPASSATPREILTQKRTQRPCNATSQVETPVKKRRLHDEIAEDNFLELERERLQLERERLSVDRERLCVERDRLGIEKERLATEKELLVCFKKVTDEPDVKKGFLDMLTE